MEETATQYYALVGSKSLDEAFTWLTPEYQRSSGGFDSYRKFWNRFDSVRVIDVEAGEDDTARVTYEFVEKGKARTERVDLDFTRAASGNYLIADGPGGPSDR